MSENKEGIKNYKCAFCGSSDILVVTDFGNMGLAGGFLSKKELINETLYPMNLGFCGDCYAVQIVDKIDPDTMFRKGYFYFSSSIGTLREHFKNYAYEIVDRFVSSPESTTILEFGCNDGVLLSPLADLNIGTLIGVDPASNVVKNIDDERIVTIDSYFDEKCADKVVKKFGNVDLILANNVFAHVDDINGLTKAIDIALGRNGVFVFEVHYLGKIIDEMQYDMIYHEHIYYYSLLALENHFSHYGMQVFDIKEVSNHGGSIRFHVCRKNSEFASISERVESLRNEELSKGFNNISLFQEFGKKINQQRSDLVNLLQSLKSEGKSIIGYGASGRANTMLQFCGIDNKLIDYMVDDAPAKTGFYTPGSHLEIKSKIPTTGHERPDYVVIFAWTFLKEICDRNKDYIESGGSFIVPLPEVKILDTNSL